MDHLKYEDKSHTVSLQPVPLKTVSLTNIFWVVKNSDLIDSPIVTCVMILLLSKGLHRDWTDWTWLWHECLYIDCRQMLNRGYWVVVAVLSTMPNPSIQWSTPHSCMHQTILFCLIGRIEGLHSLNLYVYVSTDAAEAVPLTPDLFLEQLEFSLP